MSNYPEHNSLRAVSDDSQKIGGFIEWLNDENFRICEMTDNTNYDLYVPTRLRIEQLLAKYFEIDLDKIETEKRAMLEEMRA